jgi:hypothetical protein
VTRPYTKAQRKTPPGRNGSPSGAPNDGSESFVVGAGQSGRRTAGAWGVPELPSVSARLSAPGPDALKTDMMGEHYEATRANTRRAGPFLSSLGCRREGKMRRAKARRLHAESAAEGRAGEWMLASGLIRRFLR